MHGSVDFVGGSKLKIGLPQAMKYSKAKLRPSGYCIQNSIIQNILHGFYQEH